MFNDKNRIISSSISGVCEIISIHPIDYLKTIKQTNKQFNFKNIYNGLSIRLLGVVPMRVIFWTSLDYFNSLKYSSIKSALYSSFLQTIVDYPIEIQKTNRMLNIKSSVIQSIKKINNINAFNIHLVRNSIFTICVNYMITNNDSYLNAGIGGFIGCILSQPFDSLKTWYQTGNLNYPKNWTIKDYMRGGLYRAGMSIITMNISWFMYKNIYKLLNKK